jgi:hypothetical protein
MGGVLTHLSSWVQRSHTWDATHASSNALFGAPDARLRGSWPIRLVLSTCILILAVLLVVTFVVPLRGRAPTSAASDVHSLAVDLLPTGTTVSVLQSFTGGWRLAPTEDGDLLLTRDGVVSWRAHSSQAHPQRPYHMALTSDGRLRVCGTDGREVVSLGSPSTAADAASVRLTADGELMVLARNDGRKRVLSLVEETGEFTATTQLHFPGSMSAGTSLRSDPPSARSLCRGSWLLTLTAAGHLELARRPADLLSSSFWPNAAGSTSPLVAGVPAKLPLKDTSYAPSGAAPFTLKVNQAGIVEVTDKLGRVCRVSRLAAATGGAKPEESSGPGWTLDLSEGGEVSVSRDGGSKMSAEVLYVGSLDTPPPTVSATPSAARSATKSKS